MTTRIGPRGAAGRTLLAAVLIATITPPTAAEDLTCYVEGSVTDRRVSDQFGDALPVDSDLTTFNRRLHFTFTRRAWPRLAFWMGGTFDDTDTSSTVGALDSDVGIRRLRPFFGLRRHGPRQTGQILWTRDETRADAGPGASLTTIRDGWLAASTWRPVHLPLTRLSITRTEDRDEARARRNVVTTFADLSMTKTWSERLQASYRGTWNESDDRLARATGRTFAHRGDVRYEDTWLADRVWFRSEYAVTRRETRFEAAGSGEVAVPVFPLAGLVGRDDTPLEGRLAPAPALVDDDLSVSAGIDLGLPAPGEDDRPWSLGLDMGERVAVNNLFVVVDRTIEPTELALAFTWQLFRSDDGSAWIPVQTVTDVVWDDFLRRFELRFRDVVSRYLKLVVEPLGPEIPFADRLPDLLVTELDPFRRVPVPDASIDDRRTVQTLAVDSRARLLAARDLFFEANYYLTDPSRGDLRYRLSNGLSWLHPLAPGWSISTRAALETTRDERGDNRAVVYAANLSASPVPRLHYTLSLSGRQEEVQEDTGGDEIGVYLFGSAGLYEGVDVTFGVGRAYLTDFAGRTVQSTQVNAGATIAPRQDLTLGVAYVDSTSERIARVDQGAFDFFTRAAEVNVAYTPYPSTYLYGSHRLEWRVDSDRDDVTTLVVSWAPFPGGSLRLGLNYNETRRTLFGRRETAFGPTVRWAINPRSFLELGYRRLEDEADTGLADDEILTGTLRWGF